jgi:hypothetical protein
MTEKEAKRIEKLWKEQKSVQLKRRLDELGPYETERMLKAWELAKTFASDVGQKRPYIYWEDVQKVLKKLQHDYDDIDENMVTFILQHLEQKVWIP